MLDLSDRYAKRLLGSVELTFFFVALFELSELCFYYYGNSKYLELASSIFRNVTTLCVPLYLLLKNVFCLRLLQGRIGSPERKKYRDHLFLVTFASLGYWTIASVLLLLFARSYSHPANLFFGATAVYAALVLVYDLTLRKRVVEKNFTLNLKRIASMVVVALVVGAFVSMNRDTWYLQPYINGISRIEVNGSSIGYDDESGVYTIVTDKDNFGILHLTDIHLGGSLLSRRKDLLALKACYREIEYTRPDLVIVTGDLCYPIGISSFSFNNSAPVQQFAAFMRNVGIPWAFAYGNHDTESVASMRERELGEVYRSLSFKTSGTLLYPYVQPKITGRNNQLIEIRRSDGSLNCSFWIPMPIRGRG